MCALKVKKSYFIWDLIYRFWVGLQTNALVAYEIFIATVLSSSFNDLWKRKRKCRYSNECVFLHLQIRWSNCNGVLGFRFGTHLNRTILMQIKFSICFQFKVICWCCFPWIRLLLLLLLECYMLCWWVCIHVSVCVHAYACLPMPSCLCEHQLAGVCVNFCVALNAFELYVCMNEWMNACVCVYACVVIL